ncbi:MBOAT family O-acyltransferase [Candidatus Terasakiella magnetica]|nr:MBOAT family O-acyltransferase [Candidatus Terasakiella magnetica]
MNINFAFDLNIPHSDIFLPLAISFFTFQQIAFLIDIYNGEIKKLNLLNYCVFVSFFPQLIAGPIVHHKEMMPQFEDEYKKHFHLENFLIGLSIFFIGLFKKVVIADNVAEFSTPVFTASANGEIITFYEAWLASLAYTFQLYYDFSGYSDMAIGLGRMFNIRLPLNFNSPLKATSIIDFWRTWHMTLSRFIRDYVYTPMSIPLVRYAVINRYSKKGVFLTSTALPTIIAFVAVGLWHGAGWAFIIFGFMHGFYLVINHAWRELKPKKMQLTKSMSLVTRYAARLLTFFAVLISLVLFRAEEVTPALNMLSSMFGLNGLTFPAFSSTANGSLAHLLNQDFGIEFVQERFIDSGLRIATLLILGLFALTWGFPNTYQIMHKFEQRKEIQAHSLSFLQWNFNRITAIYMAAVASYALLQIGKNSEFLYFNF